MEHHVHVGERQGAALRKHLSFLCEDVQVEPHAIPGEQGVALGDLVFQVSDQGGGFVLAESVAAVPEKGLVGVGGEGGGAGDAQRAVRSPVFLGSAGGLKVEGEEAAGCSHTLIIVECGGIGKWWRGKGSESRNNFRACTGAAVTISASG
jgi:hypothetical protein